MQIYYFAVLVGLHQTKMDSSKRISLAFGAKKPEVSRQLTPVNGTKRPRAALQDSDDEDGAEGKHQEITHFDIAAGGAIDTKNLVAPKQPLVIPVPAKKRQKSALPNHGITDAEVKAREAKAQATTITYGLNVTQRPTQEDDSDVNGSGTEVAPEPVKEKTIEEQALSALLGEKVDSGVIIPAITEEEAFHRDYDHAPDVPTEADYDAVPIEEFGAAMLRGMGWKDGEAIGKKRGQQPIKPRVIERRPDLLGVGAKPAQALGVELGEWGSVAKKHDKKLAKAYMPVVLKNKKTGETLTEDELKQKLREQEEQQVMVIEEETRRTEKRLEYRSSKSSRRDDYDKDSRKDDYRRRDREKEYDDRKHSSSRRERHSSVDSGRRRKDHDSNYDRSETKRRDRSRSSERKHRKDDDYDKGDKSRDRRRRDRSVSTEDRNKSRRHDDRHRERERDRDRERKYRDDEKTSHRERSDKDRRRDRDR
jgi:hypothetical protein